jgi:hypothetical protein
VTKVQSYENFNESLPSLLNSIHEAFENYPSFLIERSYAVYYQNFRQVLDCFGGNDYRLKHSHVRQRQESLDQIIDYSISTTTIENAIQFLRGKNINIQIVERDRINEEG